MSKRLAVCIGVNKYINVPSAKLNFACEDAQAIASVLKNQSRGNFDSVKELLDEDANKANIIETFKTLLLGSTLTKDDLVLIFFSGHGATDQGENFFVFPHDVGFLPNNSIDVTTTVQHQRFRSLTG